LGLEALSEPLSARDADILRTLRTVCTIEKRNTFSADDIFLLGLDRFFEDKVHDIGAWFAREQHHKQIEPVGTKRSTRPSNHLREIRVYAFVPKDPGEEWHHEAVTGKLVRCK